MGLSYVVGNNIKTYRIKNKDTQSTLGDKLNVSPVTVSGWETGKKEPSFDTLERIAELYRIPVQDLFYDEKTPKYQATAFKTSEFITALSAVSSSRFISETTLDSETNNYGDVIGYRLIMEFAEKAQYPNSMKEFVKQLSGVLALIAAYKSNVLPYPIYESAIQGVAEKIGTFNYPVPCFEEDDELPF